LRVWSRALGALRAKGARRLADEKLGAVQPGEPVDPSPETIIDMFLNGEHLHWDAGHASSISAHASLPEFEANLRYSYHEAIAPIACLHLLRPLRERTARAVVLSEGLKAS
jgi:hypothetical protein